MADFGTLIARDEARDVESFSPTNYDHPVEPTSDFGSQFAPNPKGPDGLGDGYYLQEPGQRALRGAPNGQASTSGQLLVEYGLAATAVGGSAAVGAISKQSLTPSPVVGVAQVTAPGGLSGVHRLSALAAGQAQAPGVEILVHTPPPPPRMEEVMESAGPPQVRGRFR